MGFIYTKKVILDGYKFDSEMEASFYVLLKSKLENKEIKDLKIHPQFILQDGFVNGENKKFEPIIYEADFSYSYIGEQVIQVVDVKGMITDDFAIKWKMYDYKFGNGKLLYSSLQVLKYSKTTGWVNYDEYKSIKRSIRKKLIEQKNNYKKKLESLPRLRSLQEKLKVKGKLTELEQKKLDELKNDLKEYL